MSNTKAYLTLSHGPQRLGTLRLLLSTNVVPRTTRNFLSLLQAPPGQGYRNSTFHRIIRGFMAQGGDFTAGDGTGGRSVYADRPDGSFADENFLLSHDERGVLSMANSGPDTNGSQFFITFRPTPHLDGKHVVFGRVDLTDDESYAVLDALERIGTGKQDRPKMAVTVVDCGVMEAEGGAATATSAAASAAATVGTAVADDDEIDLDDDDDDDDDGGGQQHPQAPTTAAATAAATSTDEIDLELEDDGDTNTNETEEEGASNKPPPPKGSKAALQARLRKLKMKMNQSRQLNRREVQSEGERLGSKEGAAQHRRQQAKRDRDSKKKEWEAMSGRAAASAARAAAEAAGASGADEANVKKLTEQAADVLRRAQMKADRAETNRFGINDHYNAEGQRRNYERDVKSIPRGMTEASSAVASGSASGDIYDPLSNQLGADAYDASSERAGARRLASELHRRAAKAEASRKRKDVDFDATDVSGINKRNKHFNEKIGRNFDGHTAEIRQNLERGTAL